MVGIVQEQHADRARLFMQWKRMGWPIFVDSLNLLEVPYVPITLLIDEHGIVRAIGPREPASVEAELVDREFEIPVEVANPRAPKALDTLRRAARESGDAAGWEELGDALFARAGDDGLDDAIAAYERAIFLEPGRHTAHFRLGVTYRRRYEAPGGRPEDFQSAIDAWSAALGIEPNNYIYRRRIQQYGPRLDKPYPFYDWVTDARREIEARGETPVELRIEPGGGELARPLRSLTSGQNTSEVDPDPQGRILRDEGGFVEVETTVVPAAVAPGSAARVHVVFRPVDSGDAYWNNEAGNLAVWLDPPEGWTVDRRLLTVENPPTPVSREARRVEFELRSPEKAPAGSATLAAHALVYVCEGSQGACLYRRRDFTVRIHVR
jgi:hypothetical protein